MPRQRTEKDPTAESLAIISLIFGVLSSIILAHLFGIIAIVCGVIAGVRGKKRGWLGAAAGVLAIVVWANQVLKFMNEADSLIE